MRSTPTTRTSSRSTDGLAGMKSWVREQASTLFGVLLLLAVAVGTITSAPMIARGLDHLPWLVYLYTGGAPPEGVEREIVDPLPFETVGVSSEELLAMGLPVSPQPSLSEPDPTTIFPAGHAVTDAANEQVVMSARRALWTWNAGTDGFGLDVMIVELPTQAWAQSLANTWAFEPLGEGEYPAGATQDFESGTSDGGSYAAAKVQFVHDRLCVVVQTGTGPLYAEAVAAGTAEQLDVRDAARQVALALDANLPAMNDLAGWEGLDTLDLRVVNAASLGAAATLTILARAFGSGVLDRGSREALFGWFRRRAPAGTNDVDLTGSVRQLRLRSGLKTLALALGSGAGMIVVYFVTGAIGLVEMFLLVAAAVLIVALVATLVRPRNRDEKLGRGWIFAEALATGLSATVVAAGIFFVGTAGIGFTLGEGSLVRILSLTMLALGLAVVGFAPYPAQLFRRLAMPAVKQAVQSDERAPVLFLRSFQDDDLRVRIRSRSKASPSARLALLNDSTFEDLLAWQASRHGPVIAIGQPGTKLQPLGAVRDYFSDADWQTAVLKRINVASAIIFVVGRSPGAQWELAQLRERGALGKTLFVFPPVDEAEFDARCFVLSAGLGLHPLTLNHDFEAGVPLVAMRVGASGQIHRYLASGRDDFAYTLAIERALAEIAELDAIAVAPSGRPVTIEDQAQAQRMLATYDPRRRRRTSVDPFRRALGLILNI